MAAWLWTWTTFQGADGALLMPHSHNHQRLLSTTRGGVAPFSCGFTICGSKYNSPAANTIIPPYLTRCVVCIVYCVLCTDSVGLSAEKWCFRSLGILVGLACSRACLRPATFLQRPLLRHGACLRTPTVSNFKEGQTQEAIGPSQCIC